jgi:glycosyltransferase involved in cell wall biosynthesis
MDPRTKIPKVSVILTFHNRPELVQRAIFHILCQTFQDFELILVDDCSDNVLDLECIDFKGILVKHLRNEKNLGANLSRLKGLGFASGDYICFHDDDDYWMEDKIEKQFNFLEKNQDFCLVTSYALTNHKTLKFPLKPSRISLSIYNCIGSFSIPMIRNSKELGKALDNQLSNAQDWHVWRCLEKCSPMATIPKVLVFFDDGPHDRISSVKNVDKYYSSYLCVALNDTPNDLIKYYHYILASYHCHKMGVVKILLGFVYFILRTYIKIKLRFEVI